MCGDLGENIEEPFRQKHNLLKFLILVLGNNRVLFLLRILLAFAIRSLWILRVFFIFV